ncbi:hypothetical protein TVAG_187970 [Trichomonas vaginalis G3]|uniref:Uncharacterized protein n=1 Tax=Trichomonas vaginalis (strain ATCC PRA-98 / G3) TaxID=412133 RepID=A2DV19_TRIV3|nr:hypothetical protein TVAGG3_0940650 [Trichomonas vaginalis G3]EAY15746.1 hypothetical protein TVAG_187970 [Trichomonas vaginalis G3]KAI5486521.1 hypothetical protein TVAGG3_0940650 [Trichomonas vaginalis G3]|eukprot:XP_001327969.1 hypothetical protein [Trichomonas vaginalis G3]
MSTYRTNKHAQTSRTPFLTDMAFPTASRKQSSTSRASYMMRCNEMSSVIEIFNEIITKYQEVMQKMPPDVCSKEFPKSFSAFRESFEQFIRTMQSYIGLQKEKENNETPTKNSNLVAVIDEISILSEKVSTFLASAEDLSVNGMVSINSTIEKSFQTIFYISNSITDAIKVQKIVNQDLISKGLELYRNSYKAYKMAKDIKSNSPKKESKEYNISDLKEIISTVNCQGYHLLTTRIPSALNNRSTLIDLRSMLSSSCAYISSLTELSLIFNESMSFLIMDILGLIRTFNNAMMDQNIPCKLDVQGLTV